MSFTLQEYNTAPTQTKFMYMLDFLIQAYKELYPNMLYVAHSVYYNNKEKRQEMCLNATKLAAKKVKEFGIKKDDVAHKSILRYYN
jgi:hypothetical protein